MSISVIEDLSNDIFYELFEYLDAYEIYRVFNHLNFRFQGLLTSTSLRLKIPRLSYSQENVYADIYKELLINHKQQIISLHLWSSLLRRKEDSFSIDSSYHSLESLYLDDIPPSILIPILKNLPTVPCLSSLTVKSDSRVDRLTEVYQLISQLPKLKYFYYESSSIFARISLPTADQRQVTSINTCTIDQSCSPEDLFQLISSMPQIEHLELEDLSSGHSSNYEISPQCEYANLTHLSIETCSISFDELQICLSYIGSNLKSLDLKYILDDFDYLDDDQWECFISDYLPKLETFHLNYNQTIDPEADFLPRPTPPNGFMSEFWDEKDWRLEIEMCSCDVSYEICSYKERWYDEDVSSNKFDKSTRLILSSIPERLSGAWGWTIGDMFDTIPIYHLEISIDEVSSDLIMQLNSQLPTLQSLKITSMVLSESINSYHLKNKLRTLGKKNQIRKLYLETLNGIDEIDFFMQLCPRLKHLKVDSMWNVSAKEFTKKKYSKIHFSIQQL